MYGSSLPLKPALRTPMHRDAIFHSDPAVMSGAPVFTGTRVPVQNLLDYIDAGTSLDEFLADFPGVQRKQASEFLKQHRAGSI
jgi:uncharacterized protein (DUF433 family)